MTSSSDIPRECPRCGCDSVCCTCGYIDELRGVLEQEDESEDFEDHDCGEDTCVHEPMSPALADLWGRWAEAIMERIGE